MKEFIVQYSIPKNDEVAVSDWTEYMTTVKAKTDREAIKKFNKRYTGGTWLVLDCWES